MNIYRWFMASACFIFCFFHSSLRADDALKGSVDAGIMQVIAPVRSEADLAAYLDFNKRAWTPLRYFSKSELDMFVKSMVFADGGLASFRTDVFSNLKPAEVYMVLAIFGSNRMISSVPLTQGGDALDLNVYKLANSPSFCAEPIIGGSKKKSETSLQCGPGQIQKSMCVIYSGGKSCKSGYPNNVCDAFTCK